MNAPTVEARSSGSTSGSLDLKGCHGMEGAKQPDIVM